MIRLRGKNAGEKLRPYQYANDWILCESPRKPNDVVRPTQVELEAEDWEFFANPAARLHSGTFWQEWKLLDNGRFVSTKPSPGQRHRTEKGAQ